jgi:hypothetical protein
MSTIKNVGQCMRKYFMQKDVTDYLMKPVKSEWNNQATFFNKLDSQDRSPDEEFIIGGEQILIGNEDDNNVRYYFNSLGYRSDEFTNHHDGQHVLFAGCSETEGVGGNLDAIWAYIMYTKLSEKTKLSGFFNLSKGGWAHETIIPNIMEYIKEYGKPDKIYMMLPNIARRFEWFNDNKDFERYKHVLHTPFWAKKDITDTNGITRKRQIIEDQRSMIPPFVILVKLFEEYCASNSIELLWSSWSEPDHDNYKTLDVFKNFVTLPSSTEVVLESIDFVTEDDYKMKTLLAKRDGHHGYFYHYKWAQVFLGLVDTKNEQ